jgi:uncharacterized repeat protein (TIGR01451 family)
MPVNRSPFVRALLLSLAVLSFAVPSARAVLLVATDGTSLARFDSGATGVVTTVPVTGMQLGETLVGIDYRPSTGQLFGIGSTSRLYTLDPLTGAATQVGMGGLFTLNGTAFGMGFNPTVDRIRVVSDIDQNIRVNPNDGALAATDTPLAYAVGDANAATNPNVVASAYTNQAFGATTTTLYGIDSALDILALQNPPNAGSLITIGSLSIDVTAVTGFDIDPATSVGYMTALTGGVSRLYTVNLATGLATLVGTIGTGLNAYNSVAIAPAGTFVFSAPSYSVSEAGPMASITINRVGGSTGAASVTFATSNGTATAGSDYTAANQVVPFADGEISQLVTFPITDDGIFEGDETVILTLSAPTNGTTLGPQSGAVLTIMENDPPPVADLSITKVRTGGVGSVAPGAAVSYTITVTNNGTAGASNVTVTDNLPAGSTFGTAVPSQGSCAGTGPVVCPLGSLANGASATIALTINAPAANGTFTNSASVGASELDPNPANNTATANVDVSNAVPTLSEWALMLMAALLGLIGVVAVRR